MNPAPAWAVDDYLAAVRKPYAARSRYEHRLIGLFLLPHTNHIPHEFITDQQMI
jgi:hypothetical protein